MLSACIGDLKTRQKRPGRTRKCMRCSGTSEMQLKNGSSRSKKMGDDFPLPPYRRGFLFLTEPLSLMFGPVSVTIKLTLKEKHMMSTLFKLSKITNLKLPNQQVLEPLSRYSAEDGIPNEWHFTHYTSRAVGGTGLIMVEMTNVEERGRIPDHCLGIWSDGHVPHYKRLVDACHRQGAKIGIQIGHAGRKARDTD